MHTANQNLINGESKRKLIEQRADNGTLSAIIRVAVIPQDAE